MASLTVSLIIPRPTSAAELTAGGWTTNATATATVTAGGKVTIAAHVTAATNRGALVDVEVYSPSGAKVFQQFWDNQSFVAGVRRSFTATWTVPASQSGGQHVVKIGIFRSRWAALQHWNDSAGKITVTTGSTTTTTTTAPTTTTPPPTTTVPPASTSTTVTPVTSTTGAPTTTVPPPAGVQFRADFSTPADVDRFVYQRIHGAVNQAPETLSHTWLGDHDMACGDPNSTHRGPLGFQATTPPMISAADMGHSIWHCTPGNDPARGHMMTAFDSPAYGHVDFMPNQIFNDVRRVCFDANWTELGGRKWVQVVVVPEAYFQANNRRMSYARQGLEGDGNVAASAVLVRQGTFMFDAFRSQVAIHSDVGHFTTYGSGFNDNNRFYDRAARFTQCITDNGNGTVTVSRPNFPATLGGPETRTMPGRFPDGPARVIFQDVTYDGPKGDDPSPDRATWHWDNIEIT